MNIIQEGDNLYHPALSKKGKDLVNYWVGQVLNSFTNKNIVIGYLKLPLNETIDYSLNVQDNCLRICGNTSESGCFD